MSGEEDNFDIDIYGDRGGEEYHDANTEGDDAKAIGTNDDVNAASATGDNHANNGMAAGEDADAQVKTENQPLDNNDNAQKILSTDDSGQNPVQLPKQAPQAQGLKRKDGTDDRPVDIGATSALMISELHWWVTDDDVRGWANQTECEDELDEVTFSEHKINGKSKGQAYTLFKSPQAATAMKRTIESFGEGQHSLRKFSAIFTNPYTNPFKTTPKDGAMRNGSMGSNRGGYNSSGGGQSNGYNNSGGYRGRGGYNNRGSMHNNMPGGFNRGGYQNSSGNYNSGGFQSNPMGGNMNYGGFNNRGGGMMRGGQMSGMRGGRGAMPMNMGMPNMGMGGMPAMGMGMPNMGMPAFQGSPQYNPGFFGQQQMGGSGDGSWNPHGAKRTRQE